MLHEPLKLDIELRNLMFSLLGSSLLAVESSLAVAPCWNGNVDSGTLHYKISQ